MGENALTLDEAKKERLERERESRNEEVSPEFSVFKDGFGQVSPLYSVKVMCDDMKYGVTFDEKRGNCNFTREYCKRFGLTYFQNGDVHGPDCKLATSQRIVAVSYTHLTLPTTPYV